MITMLFTITVKKTILIGVSQLNQYYKIQLLTFIIILNLLISHMNLKPTILTQKLLKIHLVKTGLKLRTHQQHHIDQQRRMQCSEENLTT